jgi:putative transposase
MNQPIHPLALFRLSVLGPLASRDQLSRGELKTILHELASKTYHIPDSKRTHLSTQIIERWYYAWLRGGIVALAPKIRSDKNKTQLSCSVQNALLDVKKDNPARSINSLISILEHQGIAAKGSLARATVHRFLKRHQLSKRTRACASTIERRSFVAERSGDIWYGDVMHGPMISTPQGHRKVYLVSLMDDASRIITHSAFCLGETALDIEGVLQQAILKRGIPKKLVIDNGAAYRAHSLQGICALLQIQLIYCRPYEPEGKGKLERYHRTFRERFLSEINLTTISSLEDLNTRLWVWVEQVYHQTPHQGLQNKTPIARFRQDIGHFRIWSNHCDITSIFYHRMKRKVRKDGTVQWEGESYEVPHGFVNRQVILVIDPHAKKALSIEATSGASLGEVTLLNKSVNLRRRRQRPELAQCAEFTVPNKTIDAVELAYEAYQRAIGLSTYLDSEEQ